MLVTLTAIEIDHPFDIYVGVEGITDERVGTRTTRVQQLSHTRPSKTTRGID